MNRTKCIQRKNLILGEGIPKICVPITGQSQEKIFAQAEKVKEELPDLVEWRADYYVDLENPVRLTETLQGLCERLEGLPLLFTIRTKAEGGEVSLALSEYVQINLTVAKSHIADFIDVEVFGDEEEKICLIHGIQEAGALVIASSHDFAKTDDAKTLLARFQTMDRTGADILKMAVMPQKFEDVLILMQVTHEMTVSHTEKPVIAMSMGSLGVLSRVAGEQYGSALSFGTAGEASAPGQIPIGQLRQALEILHV